jgi:hypothetical protein
MDAPAATRGIPRCAAASPIAVPACGLDGGDVDFPHRHHRLEGALGGSTIRVGDRFHQGVRRDPTRHAVFVLAPSARAFATADADDRTHKRSVSAWSTV